MTTEFEEKLAEIATSKQLHTSSVFVFSKMDEKSLAAFKELWPTVDPQRRREVFSELVEIGEVNFEVDFSPVFLLGLTDEEADVRAHAINGLWEQDDPLLIAPFLHMLQTDEAPVVRAAAAMGLGRFVYLSELEELESDLIEPVKNALFQTIHRADEEIEVRRRAVEAISYFSGEEIAQIIESAYYDDNEKMQVSAIFAMGRNADARWLPRVVGELDNVNTEIRFEAARSCGELEASAAVPKLVVMIDEDEEDIEVKEMAIWSLGRIGGDLARETLEACSDSEVEAIRLAAEEALDEINLFSGNLDLLGFDEEGDIEDFLGIDVDDYDELESYSGDYRLN